MEAHHVEVLVGAFHTTQHLGLCQSISQTANQSQTSQVISQMIEPQVSKGSEKDVMTSYLWIKVVGGEGSGPFK